MINPCDLASERLSFDCSTSAQNALSSRRYEPAKGLNPCEEDKQAL
ncbi:hypothetical protein CEV34_4299 [Brucella pseudogrignonensis]|uniref:Uncharacterized protein n=1 Tax=Brucella pseudogrignonensis TaxID=419475 RepID=A0A256G5S9_9HYPH|nr:hypothetical protein CEV34_4299 [Brucella pseudogrignonensis]